VGDNYKKKREKYCATVLKKNQIFREEEKNTRRRGKKGIWAGRERSAGKRNNLRFFAKKKVFPDECLEWKVHGTASRWVLGGVPKIRKTPFFRKGFAAGREKGKKRREPFE